MSALLAATQVQFSTSEFVPLALGFFGLGTGYLIYGPEELFKLPARNRGVDLTTGLWGIWMPGFIQLLTGIYLWVGLAWLHTFSEKPLYMAALAFTAYGVHWFAIGMTRSLGGDARPNGFMAVAFLIISVLGIVVFFHAGDDPVGGLFIGLSGVYLAEIAASLGVRSVVDSVGGALRREPTALGEVGERVLGFFHLGTGLWLMYLVWAVTLGITSGIKLPM